MDALLGYFSIYNPAMFIIEIVVLAVIIRLVFSWLRAYEYKFFSSSEDPRVESFRSQLKNLASEISPKPLILSPPHLQLFFLSLVPQSAEMQYSMKNNPVQLISESGPFSLRIVPHPINAYIYFANYPGAWNRQIKCDDISEVIMLQVLPIHIKQKLISAKNHLQR